MTELAPEQRIATYQEFYFFYLSQHADETCRRLHYVGTTLVIAVFLYALFTLNFILLLALPVCGYFFAWVGHFGFEKNKPATFTYPLWSLRGDFHMYFDALMGRLAPKLEKGMSLYL